MTSTRWGVVVRRRRTPSLPKPVSSCRCSHLHSSSAHMTDAEAESLFPHGTVCLANFCDSGPLVMLGTRRSLSSRKSGKRVESWKTGTYWFCSQIFIVYYGEIIRKFCLSVCQHVYLCTRSGNVYWTSLRTDLNSDPSSECPVVETPLTSSACSLLVPFKGPRCSVEFLYLR